MKISVIICAHNPRQDYLERTLNALRIQTLSKEQWELLLVDNASQEPLAGQWDLAWHPRARHIREEQLGLTPARFRGIREAAAEVLVFVDDDNVVAPDYLAAASKLALSHSWVGAFGGNITGEFETQPESWAVAVMEMLAIISVKHEEWFFGQGTNALAFAPCGAGMVIRRKIATYYASRSAENPLRRSLGRKGASLASCEDSDLALSACALGFAVGRFPQLQLTHLIAARRVERDYLLRLAEEMAFSHAILHFIWNGNLPAPEGVCRSEKLFQAYKVFKSRLSGGKYAGFGNEIRKAKNRGLERAGQILRHAQR